MSTDDPRPPLPRPMPTGRAPLPHDRLEPAHPLPVGPEACRCRRCQTRAVDCTGETGSDE